jgi:hypothetical protein
LAEVQALAAEADRSVEGGFAVTINFQPDDLGNVAFTRGDYGRPYAERGNGLTYGWNRDLNAAGAMFDRDSDRDLFALKETSAVGNGPAGEAQDVDERYDTGAIVQDGDTWSIDVPDGKTYALAMVVGDPVFGESGPTVSDTYINVHGERFIRGEIEGYWPFAEAVGYVEPDTDGRITLEVDSLTTNGRLLWVRVAEVEPLPTYETGQTLDWTRSIDGLAPAPTGGSSVAEGTIIPDSPVRRAEGGSVRLGDELVFVGGFAQAYTGPWDRVDVVNLETGATRSAEPIPDGVPETHAALAADEERGLIYQIAGQIGLGDGIGPPPIVSDAYAIDINETGAAAWTELPDLPEARTAASAFVVKDRLHVLGGADQQGVLTQTQHWSIDLVQLIDEGDDTIEWEAMPPLPFATNHATVEVFEDAAEFGGPLVVVAVGEYDHGRGYSTLRHTQRYDVDQASWSLGQLAPFARSHVSSTTVGDSLWIVAGQGRGNFVEEESFSYDVSEDEWMIQTSLPQPRKIGGVFYDGDRDLLLYIAGDSRDNGFMADTFFAELDES